MRTVDFDLERADLVKVAFELYRTGEYTLADLSDELYERGLRTRPTAKYPAQAVSINKLSLMLRDRYYLGYVKHDGEYIKGLHTPLITEDLFDEVQDVIETRAIANEKRRIHHHYLKGSVFCDSCEQAGVTQRLVIQKTINRHGTTYFYFFCRGRQNEACTTKFVPLSQVEEAVEEHYATLRLTPSFVAKLRTHMDDQVREEKAAEQSLKEQLTKELRDLSTQEENLLDLAADGTLPQARIKARLRGFAARRQKLSARLSEASDELIQAVHLIEVTIRYLENPQRMYLHSNEQQRRWLNQAFFKALYLRRDGVGHHELNEPFAMLHRLQKGHMADLRHANGRTPTVPTRTKKLPLRKEKELASVNPIEVLLGGFSSWSGSNKPSMVNVREELIETFN